MYCVFDFDTLKISIHTYIINCIAYYLLCRKLFKNILIFSGHSRGYNVSTYILSVSLDNKTN